LNAYNESFSPSNSRAQYLAFGEDGNKIPPLIATINNQAPQLNLTRAWSAPVLSPSVSPRRGPAFTFVPPVPIEQIDDERLIQQENQPLQIQSQSHAINITSSQSAQNESSATSASTSLPPMPSATNRNVNWSQWLTSLTSSSPFLTGVSHSLLVYHSVLFCMVVVMIICSAITSASFDSPLPIFLIFHAVKSILSSSLIYYRLRNPDCWRYDDGTFATDRAKHFHLIDHCLRCVAAAFVGVMTWWLCASDSTTSPTNNSIVNASVWIVLVIEYLAVLFPIIANVALSFFIPCARLSFFVPYLPFPNLHPESDDAEAISEDKTGMSDHDLTLMPVVKFHTGLSLSGDSTCAVCLCDMELNQSVRVLNCQHCFHSDCITIWLKQRASCPLCVRRVDAISPTNNQHIRQLALNVDLHPDTLEMEQLTC